MVVRQPKPFHVERFTPSESSDARGSIQILRITNVFCAAFQRGDHARVEKVVLRELEHGEWYFYAMDGTGWHTALASWHPVDEARNGRAKLTRIGCLVGEPMVPLFQALVEAIEADATAWFAKKGFRLRKLYTRIPDTDVHKRRALGRIGFRKEGVLPRHLDDETNALYLSKYFPEPTPEVA